MKIKFGFLTMLAMASMFVASCSDSEETTPAPIPTPEPIDTTVVAAKINVPDGWYVIGKGTAVNDTTAALVTKGAMVAVRNEKTQTVRPELQSIFIAVKAGAEGFNLVKVANKVPTYYGPDAVTVVDAALRTGDEPKVDFQRGTVKASATVFTVPSDALYQVTYDTKLNIVAICPVQWGLIGGATLGGWSNSTPFNSTFDLNKIVFTVDSTIMTKDNYKFRFSEGWKIEIGVDGADPVLVNTNFGNDAAENGLPLGTLIAGGKDIANDPGTFAKAYYKPTYTWELGKVDVVTVVKLSEIQDPNDWSATVVEFVGDAIDGTQAGAVDDASGWNWGNLLSADDSGLPVVGESGTDYTYTWTTVVTVAGGCKVRTAGGVASGGINFDAGYAILDVANSTTEVTNDGGNLKFAAAGSYKAVLTVDAANADAKVLTITKL